jgi:zinc protease
VLDKSISRDGGMWNAFTYLDWTAFFQTMPAGKIDLAIELEADRMVNSKFDPAEVESERTVIISEREGSENEPLFRLGEAVQHAAFNTHTYRHEVIGDMQDLRTMTRNDLHNHYKAYYSPRNAVVAVAGDFKTPEMLQRLEKLYTKIPSGKVAPRPAETEGEKHLETRLEVSGPGETTYIQLAYISPRAVNTDFFALTVLDSLLTGPSGLNMFGGGGISNRTSRLYRALVEKELAVGVGGGLTATIDPYLYDITITVHPGRKPEDVMAVMDEEISRVLDNQVPKTDIARAVKQARALFAYGSESITNQGFWLGYSEMFASYDWFLNYVEELEKVTPADVQRAAQTYLRPNNRVVGIYLPAGDQGGKA